ncbi:hypothetical protein KI387_013894, partial [Taxus chinensis]
MRCGFFISVLVLLFLMSFPPVMSEYRNSTCNNASTYTQGSTYSSNLDQVITDLFRNTPQSSGFNTSTRGQSPNQVYGLLQCIGNISAEKCSTCSREANGSIQELCADYRGGLIWMDYCFLRYDNTNFISRLDNITLIRRSRSEVTSNMQNFSSTASILLSNLSDKAYNPANRLFAVGMANYPTSGQVYGLVQCLRDLSMNNCRTCLSTARKAVEACCSTRQGAQAMLGSCTVRYETYPFFDSADSPSPSPEPPSPPPTTPSPEPPSSPPSISTPIPQEAPSPAKTASQTKSKKKSSKILPITLGLVGGIILTLVICLIGMRKRVKAAIFGMPVTVVSRQQERHGFSPESGLLMQEQHFIFNFEELADATENFHDNKKLGEGGFGAVYKGTTRDGKEIAVKKLSARSTQGKKEFMNEVRLMANFQHRNLVKLLGCCAEGDERLLVYEYLPNRSLDTFLFDPEKCRELDWQKRYNIILGIARGLLYLHEDSQPRIIHRDIKANNILLDNKFNPKIADFGLARLFPDDETHIQTRVAGTYGYMAPEYAMGGKLSVKADVYSFGVLLLEILSGRINTDFLLPHQMQNLLEWAWSVYEGDDDVLSMVDSTIRETCPRERALRCIHLGLLCVQTDATLRPSMSNVIIMISSSSVTLPNPTKPALMKIGQSHGPESKSKSISKPWSDLDQGSTSQTSGTTTSSRSGVKSSVSQVDPR